MMTRRSLLFLLFTVALSLTFAPAGQVSAAGSTPEEVVTEMTTRLKETRDPVVLLDYIHWPTAYAAYRDVERRGGQGGAPHVNSPEALRDYLRGVLGDPERYLGDQLEARAKRLPPELGEKLRASGEGLKESMREIRSRIQARIGETTYKIARSSVEGDTARVTLAISLGDETKERELVLRRIEGGWYLPSVDFARAEGGSL